MKFVTICDIWDMNHEMTRAEQIALAAAIILGLSMTAYCLIAGVTVAQPEVGLSLAATNGFVSLASGTIAIAAAGEARRQQSR